jgi:hypothetical protein
MTSTGIELTTITFVHFTHLLPLGKIITGGLNHWPSIYLVPLLFCLLSFVLNFYLFQVMCICTSANTQCTYAHAAWALHTLHMHVKFTLHTPCTRTPNMPYTCHKPVLHKLHMHCILATRMPYIGNTLSICRLLAAACLLHTKHM